MAFPVRIIQTRKTARLLILIALALACCSCSAFLPSGHPPPCIPCFPDSDGWYGGDGAYSIPLDGRRTLWLFGDTFVSEEKGRLDRIGMDIVLGTTLGISTCSPGGKFSISYFLKKKNGKFVSSFGAGEWLWPQDPFMISGVLYIPLLLIEALPDSPAPFNFRVAGHRIARIRDFSAADPREWPVDYLDWTGALPGGIEALATASVVSENFVYFFPLFRSARNGAGISGNLLARIAVRDLQHPEHRLEYLTRDNQWQNELKAEEVKILFPSAVSELSVRYSARDRRWIAVYSSPDNKGRSVLYASAPALEGPWSPPKTLVDPVEEINPASPLFDRHTFCYAGKEHPEFAHNRSLVVTYVCNTSEDPNNEKSFLRRNLFLYRPRVMDLPAD
jgi:hypothetical protein